MSTGPDDYIDPHEAAALRRKAIDECPLCDTEGYNMDGPFLVCDHVDRTEINRRGMALVREALAGKPNDPSVLHRYMLNNLPPVADPEPITDDIDNTICGSVYGLSGNWTLEPEDPEPEL